MPTACFVVGSETAVKRVGIEGRQRRVDAPQAAIRPQHVCRLSGGGPLGPPSQRLQRRDLRAVLRASSQHGRQRAKEEQGVQARPRAACHHHGRAEGTSLLSSLEVGARFSLCAMAAAQIWARASSVP